MKALLHLAWLAAALARPAAAGGEEMLQALLAEGYEFKVATERFVIVQKAPVALVGRSAPAYLCPIDPAEMLQSLRQAVCEPLERPGHAAAS
jgi:hypothetical protein